MTANDLREKFIQFFQEKGHAQIPSASLIPENDPTVLFTTAGMHPLVPYLLGEKHPAGKRLVNVQKCIRTGDIDEVGDNTHLTFFEMLGNWSLGDYSKKEAIEWSFEFLTGKKWLGIDPKMLAVSVYEGDENIPADEEAAKIWHKLGIPKERIAYLAREDNWWGPAGETGPCGPDSEMFYWTGDKKPPKEFDPEDKRWVEIWNDVFMQYNKTKDGAYEPLAKKNIDTGMGLERTLTVLSGKSTVYDTELFQPILKKIEELSGKKYGNAERSQSHAERGGESTETAMSMRIIADHIRAATFILGDDKAIVPSNKEQGYILRRLIRRAIRHGYGLGIKRVFIFEIAEEVIFLMKDAYFELGKNRDFIINQLVKEEEKFRETLERGLKEFNKITGNSISGEQAFHLYDTYGFPLEMTLELARETGKQVDVAGFHKSFSRHQALSRAGAEQKFKGGLADTSEISTKYHTATHLLHAALRNVLGEHVEQRGSNITAERMRFDFSHGEKMTDEQIKRVEEIVNEQITKDLPVYFEEMSVDEAKSKGALGLFGHKYGDKVKVYNIGSPSTGSGSPFSKEICGGPHVERTGTLGKFKIQKEEASSAGIRRIKAILSY